MDRDRPSLGIAMIGTGMVAKTHLLAIRDAAEPLHLVGVCARRPEGAAAFAEMAQAQLGRAVEVFGSVEAIATDPRVDIALILTPPDARTRLIAPLATAGKAILIEKPVGRTLAEAREVVETCAAASVPLGVVFQHRMREASIAALGLVQSGRLGALGLVDISVPWWRDQSYYDEPGRGTFARDGGGVMISQAIHTLDLALTLTGPVTRVVAMTATSRFHDMEAEDVAAAGLSFANGATGWMTATTAAYPGASESISLHFERASLRLADGICDVSWRDGGRETFGSAATTGGGADPMAFTHSWHQSVLEDFARRVLSGGPPSISGRDALSVHRVIDAITRSAAMGRPIDIEETVS